MVKICTSIEQSKKLLELGLSPNSSDMHYHFDDIFDELESVASITEETPEEHFMLFPDDIPAWSLTSLLEMLPITFKMSNNIYTGARAFIIDVEDSPLFEDNGSFIDLIVDVYCWLLKKDILKAKTNDT